MVIKELHQKIEKKEDKPQEMLVHSHLMLFVYPMMIMMMRLMRRLLMMMMSYPWKKNIQTLT